MSMNVLIADDHALVREGLKPFLEELSANVTLLEADSFDRAMAQAKATNKMDLIILDLAMPGMDTLGGVRKMLNAHPDVPVVILSGTSDQSLIMKAFNLGVAGFIPKTAGSHVMMMALNLVLSGERYIPSSVLTPVAAEIPTTPWSTDDGMSIRNGDIFKKLSLRERTVLEHLVGGMTNKEIARAIELQEATVKIHVKNIYRKMGVANRAQAVRTAIQPDWTSNANGPAN